MLFKQFRDKQTLINKYWEIWSSECLTSLWEKQKLSHRARQHAVQREPCVDEVVIIQDEMVPRGCWKLGRIIRLIRSGDGEAKAAEVELSDHKRVERPLNHLHPLEVRSCEETDKENRIESSNEASEDNRGITQSR